MPLNDDDFMRYSRHLLMDDIGEVGQQRLSDARVLIVGLGGLGCPVALYLAAAGVGQIGLCDPDHVDITNLQRQVLYRTDDCGRLKVDCAKQALEALNPGIVVSVFPREIGSEILADRYDLVVDCTDNLEARQIMNRACYSQEIPFVSAAAVVWEGQLVAFDFGHFRSLCFDCIIDHNSAEPVMNCANSGVVGPVLGIMGSMQATTVIRLLLGYFEQHGEMTRYDGKRGQWLLIHCNRNLDCPTCGSASD